MRHYATAVTLGRPLCMQIRRALAGSPTAL
jgi:hypothetical protein